jgi:hypothetical protein
MIHYSMMNIDERLAMHVHFDVQRIIHAIETVYGFEAAT